MLRGAPRPPYSCIAMESPVNAQPEGSSVKEDAQISCEKPFSAAPDFGGQFAAQGAESVVVLGAGAAAKLVRLRQLKQRKENTGKQTNPPPNNLSSECPIQIRRRTPR